MVAIYFPSTISYNVPLNKEYHDAGIEQIETIGATPEQAQKLAEKELKDIEKTKDLIRVARIRKREINQKNLAKLLN